MFPEQFHRGQMTTIYYMDASSNADADKDAFLIELHAMHADYDERLVTVMLQAIFQVYPKRSYALLSMPSDHPYMPLLAYFVVCSKELSTCDPVN